jgi:phosphatidylglycerol---prolipoprotein diacylglyceryl transferase
MWIHDLNPVLLEILGLEIRYYGLVYVLGFLFAIWWMQRYRREIGLNKEEVYDFIFYMMLGLIIGSRLFHVLFWDFSYYFSQPWKIFYLWEGGMAFHGGLVGSVVVAWWYCKIKKISFLKVADILSIPGAFALAFGRIANFINAEVAGRVSDIAWAVDFGDGQGRHPYQIYASLKRFFVGGVLVYLSTKKLKEGFIFLSLVFLLGLGRFILDFYREDVLYFSLSVGQWMSLAMIIIAGVILIKKYRQSLRKVFK